MFFQDVGCKIGLTLSILFCRRVVDAEAPLAIVVPARGSSCRTKIREKDLSWNNFLGKARSLRYNQCIQYCLLHFHIISLLPVINEKKLQNIIAMVEF